MKALAVSQALPFSMCTEIVTVFAGTPCTRKGAIPFQISPTLSSMKTRAQNCGARFFGISIGKA